MPDLIYLGHAAFYLKGTGGRIVIDPFLSGNPLAKSKPEDIIVDYILISHGHGDHLGDGVQIAKANNATIIAPFELANYCEKQGAKAHPMHIGGSHNFPFGKVKLTIAHHGSSAPDGTYTGNPCGFLITMDGKTIYHTGDTGLFYDMKLIGEMNRIDVALLPVGDNFTMGIDDAVKAAELLSANLYIPMHYKTFDLINVEPADFIKRVEVKGMKAKLLSVGETVQV